MVPMTALCKQNYNGRSYLNGDDMNVLNESDAADLICLGWAQRRKSDVPPMQKTVEVRDMKAEPGGEQVAQTETTQQAPKVSGKDKYSRRDMRAAR